MCGQCKKFFKIKCKYCGNEFCSRCILPEIHNCPDLKVNPVEIHSAICPSKIAKI